MRPRKPLTTSPHQSLSDPATSAFSVDDFMAELDRDEAQVAPVAPMKLDTYAIMSRAVSEGIAYGMRRAYKHSNDPKLETIEAEVESAVMSALSDVIVWY